MLTGSPKPERCPIPTDTEPRVPALSAPLAESTHDAEAGEWVHDKCSTVLMGARVAHPIHDGLFPLSGGGDVEMESPLLPEVREASRPFTGGRLPVPESHLSTYAQLRQLCGEFNAGAYMQGPEPNGMNKDDALDWAERIIAHVPALLDVAEAAQRLRDVLAPMISDYQAGDDRQSYLYTDRGSDVAAERWIDLDDALGKLPQE